MKKDPHIVMVVPRGETVRNFLYSDTLPLLSENARITLVSVINDEKFISRFRPFVERIIPLKEYGEKLIVRYFRNFVHDVHFRWLWSEVAKNRWEIRDYIASQKGIIAKIRWNIWKASVFLFANRRILEALTKIENYLSYILRPTDYFDKLFKELKPDAVFNCSQFSDRAHIGDTPVKVAHNMGIPTVVFIFSWDNLTSRSRIFAPYDYYLVWNKTMREKLLSIYAFIPPERIIITGTPQFDFHFKPEFCLERAELCKRIGIDPQRPFVLYTAGIDRHFPEEYRTVELVIKLLQEINIKPKPQLVVRIYVKGISPEMKALAKRGLPDVVFPPVLWEEKWFMPMYEDLAIYTSLLHHCCMGINPASTVSLELMIHDKPIINLGLDPPGSNLPHHLRWMRHINFDHFKPVAESGAVMVARSEKDLKDMLIRGLTHPRLDSKKRCNFLKNMFGDKLDGNSGRWVAEALIKIAKNESGEII